LSEAGPSPERSEIGPLYLFVDGPFELLRPGAKREAILCAWCLTWAGKKVLVGLAPGLKESKDGCRDFLQDLQRRGLSEARAGRTDGAPGVIAAVETCWPAALRQRCLAHKMRNLLAKVPEEIRASFAPPPRLPTKPPRRSSPRSYGRISWPGTLIVSDTFLLAAPRVPSNQGQGVPMVRMFVRHRVNDFATWKAAYDAFDEERSGMGVRGDAVFQAVDDPNDVTAWHDFDSTEAAQAFAESPRLREVMEGAGVAGPPSIWFATRA